MLNSVAVEIDGLHVRRGCREGQDQDGHESAAEKELHPAGESHTEDRHDGGNDHQRRSHADCWASASRK